MYEAFFLNSNIMMIFARCVRIQHKVFWISFEDIKRSVFQDHGVDSGLRLLYM